MSERAQPGQGPSPLLCVTQKAPLSPALTPGCVGSTVSATVHYPNRQKGRGFAQTTPLTPETWSPAGNALPDTTAVLPRGRAGPLPHAVGTTTGAFLCGFPGQMVCTRSANPLRLKGADPSHAHTQLLSTSTTNLMLPEGLGPAARSLRDGRKTTVLFPPDACCAGRRGWGCRATQPAVCLPQITLLFSPGKAARQKKHKSLGKCRVNSRRRVAAAPK